MKIEPFISIDSLFFGESTRKDCISLYGKPINIRTNREGIEEFHYDEFIIRFNPLSNTLRECTLLPEATATIHGINVTWDRVFLREACELDGNPVEVYGFVVMQSLGVAVTGIHDDDRSQLAVTVFSKGEFDSLMGDATPFCLS